MFHCQYCLGPAVAVLLQAVFPRADCKECFIVSVQAGTVPPDSTVPYKARRLHHGILHHGMPGPRAGVGVTTSLPLYPVPLSRLRGLGYSQGVQSSPQAIKQVKAVNVPPHSDYCLKQQCPACQFIHIRYRTAVGYSSDCCMCEAL